MSDEQQRDQGEYDSLRRLLRGLPKSEASPDFELRLQRRIREASEAPDRGGEPSPLRRRFAIPAFAYSLLTLLVVGLISYYAFLDPPVAPPVPDSAPPADAVKQDAPPPAQPRAESEESVRSDAVQEPPPPSGREAAPAGQGPSADAQPKRAAGQAPRMKIEENPAVEYRKEAATPPLPPAAPEDEDASAPAPAAAEPQHNLLQEQKSVGLPDVGRNPLIGPTAAPLSRGLAPSQKPMLQFTPELLDTAAVRDSVAKDSLDRLKSRVPGIRKPRVRKPNG